MPLVCIQCAMKALLAGEMPPVFEESNEEHMARVHPDPAATQRERDEMEREISTKFTDPLWKKP